MAQRKIVLITTGGTISTADSGQGALPARGARELLGMLGPAAAAFDVEALEFDRIPGCEMTPSRMVELARTIERELERPEVKAAVVTHGTDTIEESAFFCHLTVASDKPVVFTGSMRHGSELGWDGPRNLLDALRVARAPRAPGLGTLLVMNDEIHSARFVTKTNGLTLATFGSPACGPLGRVYDGVPLFLVAPVLRRRVVKPLIEPSVALLPALSGETALAERALGSPQLRGFVIDGFGSGRVPFAWLPAIEAALGRGLAGVLASRTGSGAVGDAYGYQGARHLLSLGLIAAHELPAHQARLKLMLGLGNRLGAAELKEFFEAE